MLTHVQLLLLLWVEHTQKEIVVGRCAYLVLVLGTRVGLAMAVTMGLTVVVVAWVVVVGGGIEVALISHIDSVRLLGALAEFVKVNNDLTLFLIK